MIDDINFVIDDSLVGSGTDSDPLAVNKEEYMYDDGENGPISNFISPAFSGATPHTVSTTDRPNMKFLPSKFLLVEPLFYDQLFVSGVDSVTGNYGIFNIGGTNNDAYCNRVRLALTITTGATIPVTTSTYTMGFVNGISEIISPLLMLTLVVIRNKANGTVSSSTFTYGNNFSPDGWGLHFNWNADSTGAHYIDWWIRSTDFYTTQYIWKTCSIADVDVNSFFESRGNGRNVIYKGINDLEVRVRALEGATKTLLKKLNIKLRKKKNLC